MLGGGKRDPPFSLDRERRKRRHGRPDATSGESDEHAEPAEPTHRRYAVAGVPVPTIVGARRADQIISSVKMTTPVIRIDGRCITIIPDAPSARSRSQTRRGLPPNPTTA